MRKREALDTVNSTSKKALQQIGLWLFFCSGIFFKAWPITSDRIIIIVFLYFYYRKQQPCHVPVPHDHYF